eukprot:scaffold63669_cov60-Phaeocystis_antarctica.AAC.3
MCVRRVKHRPHPQARGWVGEPKRCRQERGISGEVGFEVVVKFIRSKAEVWDTPVQRTLTFIAEQTLRKT